MTDYQVKTPLLFIIFNRPDVTQKVLQRIKEVRPKSLFVIADGPRRSKPNEAELCKQTRDLISSQVDWDCDVITNYSEENMGCQDRLASGITWAFSRSDELIILEDDCLPSHSFFRYCDEMLEKYRNHSEIMLISGTNHISDYPMESDYTLSKFGSIWGWASWKRAWDHFNMDMTENDLKFDLPILSKAENMIYRDNIRRVLDGKMRTWDFFWDYSRCKHNGLCVVPQRNMVSNIGFGEGSTHTQDINCPHSNMQAFELSFPLKDDRVSRNYDYEEAYYHNVMKRGFKDTLKIKIRNFLRIFNIKV